MASVLLGMLGRSAILLRLATGAVSQIRHRTKIESKLLAPWISNVWEGSQLGVTDDLPEDLLSLWADVSDALDDLDGIADDPSPFWNPATAPLWSDRVAVLQKFSRVPLWGVAS
jgi:hypothetical protein